MDSTSLNKKDVATETSEFHIDFSSSTSSSISTEISISTQNSSTLTYTSSFSSTQIDRKLKKSTRKASHIAAERTEQVLNTSGQKKSRKPHSKYDYLSSSSRSSITILPCPILRKKEATTSTDKITNDFTNSTGSSTLVGSESLDSPSTSLDFASKSPATTREETTRGSAKEKKRITEDPVTKDVVLDTGQTKVEVSQKLMKNPVVPDGSMSSIGSSLLNELKLAPHSSETGIKRSGEYLVENKDSHLQLAKNATEPEPFLKSSKSRHVKTVTSSEDNEGVSQAPALLKSSKSQHVRGAITNSDDDDSEDDARESTNLRMGHVFVYMVIPPDGGYGWLITFISFLCQIVVDGIIFSIGIVLPHIAKDLNIPGSKVVLVASMQVGFYFLFGTVSSAFINKFGFRPVALAGCLLSITTLSIATFSVNLPMMVFFYSILGGPALSMVWVSSQLIIGYYFDKYRPIANGASCSGAGAGIMIFCYMNSVLVPVIGWRNLMRVHVGFLIVVLIMTLTFIEVVPTRIGRVKEALAEDTESESFDMLTGLIQYSRYSLKVNDQEYPLDNNFETVLETPTVSKDQKSSNCCHHCFEKCCPILDTYWERRREQKDKEEATKRYVIKQDLIERQDLFYMGPKDHKQEQQKVEELLQKRASQRVSIEDAQGGWRTISLEEFANKHKRHTIINTLSTMHMVRDQQLKRDQHKIDELKRADKQSFWADFSPKNLLHPKIRKAFSLLFDFRLLAIMEFRILLLSAFLFPMGFNIPFVFSTVRVQIDASFANLISPTIGFSNFAFRIASGFVAFKFREYTTYICGGGMFFGGVAVLVSAFYGLDVVWFQFLYAMCYGIAPAFYSTLRAIIYVRSLGLDKLTNAFGLTALAMGMGVFIGTTAGGILNDFTGSYTASFIFAGICICTSGALKLVLPYLIKLSKAKEGK